MQIEQTTYLKSITIKNKLLQQKYYYLILEVDGRVIVGPVCCIGNDKQKKQATWDTINFMINKGQYMKIQLWEYDSLNKICQISFNIKQQLKINSFIIENKLFDIEILCSSSAAQIQSNFTKITNPKQINRKQFIFPLIKTLDHFPVIKQNSFSVNLYKSQQSQFYRQSSSIDSLIWSETSLQKIMQFSSQGSKIRLKQEKSNSVQKNKNRQKLNSKENLMLFDDYEARPQRKQKIKQIKNQKSIPYESTERQHYKNFKEANSTSSSSLVKKSLKNTIAKLIQNPLMIHQRQRQNSSSQNNKNISRQWLKDYGLIDNKRGSKIQISNKNRNKIKDTSKIYDSSELQSFCQRSLSKEEIKIVQNLNSQQLSQSIFQQYGLDLSLIKSNTKSQEKRTVISSKSSENEKQKKMQVKCGKIQQKISAFNVQYKFQDYGQQETYRKQKKVK